MSRSKPRTGTVSPIRKTITFSGAEGNFRYYDKDKKENVILDDVKVILMDVRNSVTGYNENEAASLNSNMVGNTSKEVLKVVKFVNKKPVTVAEGLYRDIKDEVGKQGGKFTANVICLADVGNGEEICNIQLSGIGLTSWIEFQNKNVDYYDLAITFKQGTLSKREKGTTVAVTPKEEEDLDKKLKKNPRAPKPVWFYTVGFETEELTEEEIDRATDADENLQKFFAGTVIGGPAKAKEEAQEEVEDEDDAEENYGGYDEEDDNLPF